MEKRRAFLLLGKVMEGQYAAQKLSNGDGKHWEERGEFFNISLVFFIKKNYFSKKKLFF